MTGFGNITYVGIFPFLLLITLKLEEMRVMSGRFLNDQVLVN